MNQPQGQPIPATDLPNHIGSTVVLYDDERKRQDVVRLKGIRGGWVYGYNETTHSIIEINTSYNEKRIYIQQL